MNIIEILRLLGKHIVLLLVIPLIMAILVIYLTRNPSYKYSSETILYTGIASGSSVEMDKSFSYFANNTAFDNLINVIKSRETQQEVAIRLLSQHLMLAGYDPRYISRQSFLRLQNITPAYIKNMVVKHNRKGPRNAASPTGKRTTGNANSTPGNNMPDDTSAQNQTFSFVTLDTAKVARMMPASIDPDDFEQTVNILSAYMASNDTNFIYKLLNYNDPHYSISALSSINVQRIGSSDLVKVAYVANEPGICQQTLAFLTDVCIKNYKNFKENRSDAVVKYFEFQVKQATGRLKVAEDKLLKFNEDNNIINYYEQSKAVANVKEGLDVEFHNKRIKLAGSQAALTRIEEKLGTQQQIQLKSSVILDQRNRLASINYQISTIESIRNSDTIDDKNLASLKEQSAKLKEEIKNSVNELYSYNNSVNGLPVNSLLEDWITNAIDYEETKAGLTVLGERIKEFQKQYAIYAPAGANLKRIEREISVSEQEFLEILHGLNLAKLKMQDAELSSSIKTIDPPFFPLSPNPTKRSLLVLVAAIVGFILVLGTILAMEYLDETLKNPKRASKVLHLAMAGVFPKILQKTGTLNFLFVVNRMLEMIIQQISLYPKDKPAGNGTRTLLFFSTISNEGKTITAGNIALKLKKQGNKVFVMNFTHESLHRAEVSQLGYPDEPAPVSPQPTTGPKNRFSFLGRLMGYSDLRVDYDSPFLREPASMLDEKEHMYYEVETGFFSAHDYQDILKQNQFVLSFIPDYVLIELPPILYYPYPAGLVKSADVALLVCRANRIWSQADQSVLDNFMKLTTNEPLFLLNGVGLQVIESVLGDLPKRRSRLRRIAKKLVRFQFFSRYQP